MTVHANFYKTSAKLKEHSGGADLLSLCKEAEKDAGKPVGVTVRVSQLVCQRVQEQVPPLHQPGKVGWHLCISDLTSNCANPL